MTPPLPPEVVNEVALLFAKRRQFAPTMDGAHQPNPSEVKAAQEAVEIVRAALARPAGDAGARVDEAHRALGKPGRVDDDGCCAGCGRSVQPSPCCPDYPVGSPETCPTCGVGEPWNRYSYKTTDGDGRPLIVYTESGGDGERDECADPWHGDDLADRVLAQVKDPASPLSKALWHATPTPPDPADDAGGAEAWAYAIVNRDGKYEGIVSQDRAFLASIVKADNADDLAGAPFRVVPLAPAPRERLGGDLNPPGQSP